MLQKNVELKKFILLAVHRQWQLLQKLKPHREHGLTCHLANRLVSKLRARRPTNTIFDRLDEDLESLVRETVKATYIELAKEVLAKIFEHKTRPV